MDSLSAFALGEANRGSRERVFDWDRAAALIKERQPKEASAGLESDWEWTGGSIYRDGAPVPKDESYTYLASTWATPELSIDGDLIDCWRWKDETEWGADTFWPDSAVAILNGSS